jgi:hypothetical protein
MSTATGYLIDTSAAARMHVADVSRRIAPLIEAGVVATTASLDAEALYIVRADRRSTNSCGRIVVPRMSICLPMMNIGRRRWVRNAHWRGWGSIEPSAWRTF